MTAHGEPVPGEPGVGDSAIIFLHIGKTAGTTMRWILRRQYPASRILVTKNRTLRGEDSDPTRLPREDTLKYFASLPDADRRHASLIMAHTVFGIHEFFPQPCAYFTLLRAPVALTLSQYSYIAGKTNHRLHEQAASRTLEAFISSGVALQTDNSQTRAISGDTTTPFGECTSEMLDRAKTNIEGWFPVVGLTERFDETLLLLRQAFGWRKLHYARANVTPQRKRPPIPEPTRRLIEEQNRFDMELYAWATERFEASITSMPGFDDELAKFRRGNKLYEPWGRLTYTFPKRMAGRVRAAR